MKKILIVFSLISVMTFCMLSLWATIESQSVKNSVFRLHIVANSDSKLDQSVKILVRDRILSEAEALFSKANTRDEAIEIAKKSENTWTDIANSVLKEQGLPYQASCKIEETRFPTKHYGTISLPCGTYLAMNIMLGKANGENWWCVLYPPLCFTDLDHETLSESEKELKNFFSEEDYLLITAEENGTLPIRFRFRILELFSP